MTAVWRTLAFVIAGLGAAGSGAAFEIGDLRAALAALDRRDLGEAQRLVSAASSELTAVGDRVTALAAEARAMAESCDRHSRSLHLLQGDAERLREDGARRLAEVRARLELAMTDRAGAEAEIAAAEALMAQQKRAMELHRAKVRELETWFWVPFYGAYLGIRELVDRDSQQIGDLARKLGNQRALLEDAAHRAAVERDLSVQLAAAVSRDAVQLRVLEMTETVVHDRIAALRSLGDLLHDAEGYWREVEAMVTIDAFAEEQRFRRALERALRRAAEPATPPQLLGLDAGVVGSFEDFLDVLQFRLANEDVLSRLRLADCSADEAEAPGGPKPCPLPRFAYFDMRTDASCSFTYANPPNCPPAASGSDAPRSWASQGLAALQIVGAGQPVVTVPQHHAGGVAEAAARPGDLLGALRAEGRNFVGAARCISDEALFLGRHDGWAACAAACEATAPCSYWSYYADSRYIPGSGGECWGGTPALAADLSPEPWPGVISGGQACAAEGAACQP